MANEPVIDELHAHKAPLPSAHACDRVLSLALRPWAITPPMLSVVARILGHRLAGDPLEVSALAKRPPAEPVAEGGVAVLPVHGVLAPRMNMMSEVSGGTTYDRLGQQLAFAMRNPDISTIVLDIDSPGGSAIGATEFAAKLRAAREHKRIIAQANHEMCSAAFWLGANATEIVASPSAMLGSLGVYSLHEDLSAALEKAGIKLTYISAGKFKTDGNEAEPLSESAHARIQSLVDATYASFIGDVALGRGRTADHIRKGYGEGAVVTAQEALDFGMVDRIETFEDTVARALPSGARLAQMDAAAQHPAEPAPVTTPALAAQVLAAQRALLSLGL